MAFKIKKVKPLFTGVITTANMYVGDQTARKGSLIIDTSKMAGTLNPIQTVIAVGNTVQGLKDGDVVKLNFKRFAKAKHLPGAIDDNNVQSDNLSITYELPYVMIDDVKYLYIQNTDIEYIISEYEVDEGGLFE